MSPGTRLLVLVYGCTRAHVQVCVCACTRESAYMCLGARAHVDVCFGNWDV